MFLLNNTSKPREGVSWYWQHINSWCSTWGMFSQLPRRCVRTDCPALGKCHFLYRVSPIKTSSLNVICFWRTITHRQTTIGTNGCNSILRYVTWKGLHYTACWFIKINSILFFRVNSSTLKTEFALYWSWSSEINKMIFFW